jgi:peptide/nickel transport system permease protein
MKKYILRRIIISLPMLLGISIITFTFINLAPGDPISAMIDPEEFQGLEDAQKMRESLGLDKPIPVRYVLWLKEVLQGNFGFSYMSRRPVLDIIKSRMLATLELTTTGLVIATVLGTVFGVIAALRQYSAYDYTLSIASLFGISIPTFFFALIALYIFSLKLHWIPSFGMYNASEGFTILGNLHHLVMPAFILSIDSMSGNTRYARTAMLEVMNADYVTTARAKGLTEYVVIARHAFRNALLPMITITTLRLPGLIGGAILIEVMFSWPGMGLLSIKSITNRDYPILMGLTFFSASLVLYANLLADILYAYADPRIRVSE